MSGSEETIAWRGSSHHSAHEHALEVRKLCVNYGPIEALCEVAFRTECGNKLALIGPNGAGKSTLLKSVVGLISPVCGEILWRGKPVTKHSFEIAYLPQREAVDWNFPITLEGLVEMGRYPQLGWWRRFGRRDREVVNAAMETMELANLRHRQIRELSGGQRQRAFIARALAQEAHVLLLDEPFTGLDRPAQENLIRLLHELTREGRLIIASHHDLDTVPQIYDEALLLNRKPVAFGRVSEVFTADNIRRTYRGHHPLSLPKGAVA